MEVRFVDRHVLDADCAHVGDHVDHAIDHEERVSVGDRLEDILDVHAFHCWHWCRFVHFRGRLASCQPRQMRALAVPLSDRHGGRAAVGPARLDIAGHAGLAGEPDAVADRAVIRNAHLARDLNEFTDPRAAGERALGRNHATPPDADVVGDLHQIVDPASLGDHGVRAGSAVDGGVGTDFHVVFDQDTAELRNLHVAAPIDREAESLLADADAGEDHHPGLPIRQWLSEAPTPIRVSSPISTAGPMVTLAPMRQRAPIRAPASMTAPASTRHPGAENRRRIDHRRRVHPRLQRWNRMKQLGGQREGLVGVIAGENRHVRRRAVSQR